MPPILRTRALSGFTCLGDKCEDTCCQGWSMQLDEKTHELYENKAPELLASVEAAEETPWIMRKDPASGLCVRLEGGLCSIHKKYGDAFLGDACYFYPRVTRMLGGQVVMTATMSCPEIVRLALAGENITALEEASADRLPSTLKEYAPGGVTAPDALSVHRAFLGAAADAQADAERIFLRIASVSRSLERLAPADWARSAPFYLKHADARIPAAETDDADPFNLLHALSGLIVASKKKPSDRLKQTIADMEKALAVTLDWKNVQIATGEQSLPGYQRLRALWVRDAAAHYAPVLRRWLQMQLSLALYPYAGLGVTLSERITVIGVRLATIKLALMCSCSIYGVVLPQDVVIRLVQSLSRFMDHLGDPGFSMQIYAETGWARESRMRGLLEN